MIRPLSPSDHVVLVDCSGWLHRAYHATAPMRRADGTPVNCVWTFERMTDALIHRGVGGERATHLGVVFDARGPSFRRAIFADYKANRGPRDPDLTVQEPLVRDAVRAWGLEPIEQPGVEADDLIATYAELAADAGARVTIATQDKDFYQLVRPGVSLYDRGSGSEGSPGYRAPRWIGRDEVVAKFGVEPEQVVDVQAIMGDAVDNVPGVHGIGEKGAADLIRHFGSLDALLADIDAIPKPQHRRAFLAPSRVKDGETAVHDALLSRRLVTLDRFLLPIVPPDELVVPVPDYDRVRAFRRDMGFENGREAA